MCNRKKKIKISCPHCSYVFTRLHQGDILDDAGYELPDIFRGLGLSALLVGDRRFPLVRCPRCDSDFRYRLPTAEMARKGRGNLK